MILLMLQYQHSHHILLSWGKKRSQTQAAEIVRDLPQDGEVSADVSNADEDLVADATDQSEQFSEFEEEYGVEHGEESKAE